MLENSVLSFEPDAVFFVAHTSDKDLNLWVLAELSKNKIDIPYPYLQEVLQQANLTEINDSLTVDNRRRRLAPYEDEISTWAHKQMVDICRKHNILPVWIFLPMTYQRLKEADIAGDIAAAEDAGFVVINLSKVYDDFNQDELRLAEWDLHPNVLAHRLIADQLYEAICSNVVIKQLSSHLLDNDKNVKFNEKHKQWEANGHGRD